jgi:hypothetical protein
VDDASKAALTALFAVIVYVVGKLAERAWLDPILEVRKVIGEIAVALTVYANVSARGAQMFSANGSAEQAQEILDAAHEGRKILRERAAQLQARSYTVPWYPGAVWLGLLPPLHQIERAATGLIGYSNTIATSESDTGKLIRGYQHEIEDALGIAQKRALGVRRPAIAPKRRWWRLPWPHAAN